MEVVTTMAAADTMRDTQVVSQELSSIEQQGGNDTHPEGNANVVCAMALGRILRKMCFRMFTSGTSAPPPTQGAMYTAEQIAARRMPRRGPVTAETPPARHHPVKATCVIEPFADV